MAMTAARGLRNHTIRAAASTCQGGRWQQGCNCVSILVDQSVPNRPMKIGPPARRPTPGLEGNALPPWAVRFIPQRTAHACWEGLIVQRCVSRASRARAAAAQPLSSEALKSAMNVVSTIDAADSHVSYDESNRPNVPSTALPHRRRAHRGCAPPPIHNPQRAHPRGHQTIDMALLTVRLRRAVFARLGRHR